MKILITGGAGFIGSAMIRNLINNEEYEIFNIDSLSYAGNLENIRDANSKFNYTFKKIDISDYDEVLKVFKNFKPNLVIHFAACSHVDNSIKAPGDFVQTNIVGTYNLLEAFRKTINLSSGFHKFHHISTDEVYGDLGDSDDMFTELNSYDPSSPYSATKASSDHLVRAWGRTFDLPYTISNCSNNFGPYQHKEKLIPATIINALIGRDILIYGSGMQMRDWLYVDDHIEAIKSIAFSNTKNETYNIGSRNVLRNKEIINYVCDILNSLNLSKPNYINDFKDLIKFTDDRAGHDFRYAIDATKLENTFSWKPNYTFNEAMYNTVKWYVNNRSWWFK